MGTYVGIEVSIFVGQSVGLLVGSAVESLSAIRTRAYSKLE